MSLLFHLISLICLHLADAATVTYDFNITWLTASPDGVSRPVIGINGQWPIPQIDAMVNDTIIVNLNNQLGNESTSLHFHGIYMNGTNNMDGVPGTTQCAVPPGNSFTYKFTVSFLVQRQTIRLRGQGQSSRDVLVSLSFQVSVSRWTARTIDHPRPRYPVQRSI